MYPLYLNLTGRLAVVIGGGPVGRRRVAGLRAAGARVRLVCLEPRPPDVTDAGIDWHVEPYTPAHLDGAILVIAAASEMLNQRIVADARERGLWANNASAANGGDFIVPATVRRGDLVLAVATGVAVPSLTRLLRQRLEEEFDDTFAVWVGLVAEVRAVIRQRVADDDKRRELLDRFCQWPWLERLRMEGVEAVRAAMLAEVG
jgi:precorrin-2 dehydrogenase / sirohydrochlorin ferrochelatase